VSNRHLVDALVNGLGAGDVEAIMDVFTEDFSFDIKIPRSNPSYHLRKGDTRESFRKWIEFSVAEAEFNEFEVKDILESSNRIAVLGYEDYTIKSLGSGSAVDFVWIFEVRDGKLASLLEIVDTETAGLQLTGKA
jgi:ketosteroid isomerase-like protein